jgi:drug/metabolite transporter (DMT)-like permease
VPEHRPLDVKGVIMALVLAMLWGANPVAIKLGLAESRRSAWPSCASP